MRVVRPVRTLDCHSHPVHSVRVNPSGQTMATSDSLSLRVWDLREAGRCVKDFSTAHTPKWDEGALSVDFHPSTCLMASCGGDGVVKVYNGSEAHSAPGFVTS